MAMNGSFSVTTTRVMHSMASGMAKAPTNIGMAKCMKEAGPMVCEMAKVKINTQMEMFSMVITWTEKNKGMGHSNGKTVWYIKEAG